MREIVIGSRGSQLARQQAGYVQRRILQQNPDVGIRIEIIRTSGDKLSQGMLVPGNDSLKGLFVKEIEEALLDQRIDLAVHSLKDLPTELPDGLCLGPTPEREDARDVLVTAGELKTLADLPQGAQLGTSSLRRRVQLRHLRPDISVVALRGNIDTRIRKIQEHKIDGVVLAAAAMRRLGLEEKIAYAFPIEEMIPAVGQGALGIEMRRDVGPLGDIVAPLDHPPTRLCVAAERKFLHRMGAGCQVPMGGHAQVRNGRAVFSAFVGSPSGPEVVSRVVEGEYQDLDQLALEAAEYLLSQGAAAIIEEADTYFQ